MSSLFSVGILIILICGSSGSFASQARCSTRTRISGQEQDEDYFRPGVSAVDVLRARGYLAEEHFVRTKDDYMLSVVRGQNPLIANRTSNKEPVLFVHGIFNSAIQWILNSAGARPRDFTHLNVSSMDLDELIKLLGNHPSAGSMPILAMNLGHEIWLLNRRGTLPSRSRYTTNNKENNDLNKGNITQMILDTVEPLLSPGLYNKTNRQLLANLFSDLSPVTLRPYVNFLSAVFNYGELPSNVWNSFDRSFWNYSLDQQAEYDLPACIEHIIEHSGPCKVSLVGHSAGGALILMALSLGRQTNLLDKVSKVILWSPAFNLGHWDAAEGMAYLAQTNHGYVGPIPLVFMSQQLEAIAQVVCNTKLAQRTLCQQLYEQSGGQASSGQQPVSVAALAGYEMPVAFNDLVQLAQWAEERKPRMFDFKDRSKNLQVYGTELPPRYNLSQIEGLDGPIWLHVARTDSAVTPADAVFTAAQLKAPCRLIAIEDDEENFNHVGYFFHVNRSELVNLPSLWQLESSV